jgi:hypothetical protein
MSPSDNDGAARSKRASITRSWLVRFGVVTLLGVSVGAAAGVVGVNTLDPGRPTEPDSVQVLLDSIARGTAPSAASTPAPPDIDRSADDSAADMNIVVADPVDSISVPDLIGVEEGAARTVLTGAGLMVGTVEFRPSASPTGTVLATIPVFGAAVARGGAVALVLSDGRAPVDTSSVHVLPLHR